MLKKLFSLMIAFLMLFTLQSQSFAAVNQAEKVEQSIQIEKDQFFEQSLPYEMARRERSRDNDSESTYGNPSLAGLWWLSIFITGLGQVVMGDFWRGLSFYGWAIVAGIILYAISPYSASSMFSTVAFIIAIWNIIDAYMMSVEITEGRDEDAFLNNYDSTKMAKLDEKLAELEALSKKINMSGSNVSFKALAF